MAIQQVVDTFLVNTTVVLEAKVIDQVMERDCINMPSTVYLDIAFG